MRMAHMVVALNWKLVSLTSRRLLLLKGMPVMKIILEVQRVILLVIS